MMLGQPDSMSSTISPVSNQPSPACTPIEVTVSPRRDRLVKVVSRDLGKSRVLRSAREVADHSDPGDWCCLVKAALAVTGFRFGSAGLDIVISADLPKGSGMGTSSILGAATIAALLQATEVGFVRGGEIDVGRVGALTLALEREMRTGGGWEDQFAGMTPGVKMMRSRSGAEQRVVVEPVAMPPKAMRELMRRSLLFFTGQKRHFGRKAGKHAASKIAHPVKQRLIPGSLVLLGIPGKIIQFFRIPVLAGSVKKADSRKACEIFLTGLQLIGT